MGVWDGSKFYVPARSGYRGIVVSATATKFVLKDGAVLLGQVPQSGVFLHEDGSPGALQQVDLKV